MKNILKILMLFSFVAIFAACSDDDDNTTKPTVTDAGSITVNDQMISQNTIIVQSATFKRDGWIVVHADNGEGGPQVPDIISDPVLVKAGTSTDILVPLNKNATMLDGDTQVWLMLHTDDGTAGAYEFDGSNGLDLPLKDREDKIIMKPITISPAKITASDQVVTNTVTVSVDAAADGWIVIHNENENGEPILPGIIGKAQISKGVNSNVVITLDEGVNIMQGQKLFPMVHIDAGTKGEYSFPGTDVPEVFGFDGEENAKIIMKTINVL